MIEAVEEEVREDIEVVKGALPRLSRLSVVMQRDRLEGV